uniref:Uncharacterized protein n=1 Tax=Caenorhabditis japonica TaxID=281687 RepID=A0A8R1J470_CAEJA
MVDLKLFGIAILFTQIGSVVMATPTPESVGFFAGMVLTLGVFAYVLILFVPVLCLACSVYCSVLVIMRMNQKKAAGATSAKASGKDSESNKPPPV